MAEGGIVDRFFEGDEEEGEGEKLGAADPIAAAVAIDAARFDPELSAKAGKYLDEQSRLIAIQTEHLHEQREIQLSHLKLRRWSERMRVGLQFFLALIGTLIGLGILVILYDAFTSKNVVVEAFQTPPALAGRGLNGTVVATELLDGLQKLQDATRGPSKGLATKSAWSSDIKVELPETGISIGEVDRLLHERFSHDVRIDGDLIQTPAGGLALTVRGDDVAAKTFAGGADDLDKLTTQAAEYVYGRSQPWLYSVYLIQSGRLQDVLDFMAGAFPRAADADRPNLANTWAIALMSLNKQAEASEKFRTVMDLSPPYSETWWKGWGNLLNPLMISRGEEAGWRESVKYLRTADAASSADKPALRLVQTASLNVWDLSAALKSELADAEFNKGAGANNQPDGPSIAETYAQMHDPVNTAHFMAISDLADTSTIEEARLLQAYAALDRADPAAAVAPMELFYKDWLADTSVQTSSWDGPCFLAAAYGLSGRTAEAEAVFKRMGSWSRCIAFHGDILAHEGDVAGAMRVWADGLKIMPDLVPIYLHRGLFELSRGDLRAAQADFATGHAKSPHYADPLKGWGDVLARAGRWREALAKYDEALRDAPNWVELHRARDFAAKRAAT